MEDITPQSSKRLRYHRGVRSLLIAAAVTACIAISFYVWFVHTKVEPYRAADQIYATIKSLASKCPATMRKEQWEVAMFWTANLAGNSLLPSQANLNDLRRFQHELEEKAKGDVDMALIFWIWDKHAELTPAGRSYQRFRKTMLDEMRWDEYPSGRERLKRGEGN
jgi:hypothetical protein